MVGLSEAVRALRFELQAASADSGGESLRFEVEPVELTVQVAVTKGANGKVGWQMLGVGATYDRVVTHTLKLQLKPIAVATDGTRGPYTVARELSPDDTVGPPPRNDVG
jgi:hypothetical protein